MLERAPLWLGPWQPAPPLPSGLPAGEPPLLAIFDAARKSLLGVARRASATPRWLGWLARPTIEVLEQPDHSLLLTLVQGWATTRAWAVLDADGQRIGSVRGPLVRDRAGRPLATRDGTMRWLTPAGKELGSTQATNGGVIIRFTDESHAGSPFVKMLLLGSVLQELLAESA